MLVASSTLKETLDSITEDGNKLNQALMAAQAAGSDASTGSIMDALGRFQNTLNNGHLKAAAILEVLQATQLDYLGDKTSDDLPPPSKSRYSAQRSGKAKPALLLLVAVVCVPASA